MGAEIIDNPDNEQGKRQCGYQETSIIRFASSRFTNVPIMVMKMIKPAENIM